MIVAVYDHTVAVFSLHILHKLLCKPDFIAAEGTGQEIVSFHIENISAVFCPEPEFLYGSFKNIYRVLPGTVMKKFLHFFHGIGLQDKKARSAAAVCDLVFHGVRIQHFFFETFRMSLFDMIKQLQIPLSHDKTDRGHMRICLGENQRFPRGRVHNHPHKIISCGEGNQI